MTDAAVTPRAVTAASVTATPSPVVPAAAEVADLFDVLATSAHWFDREHPDALFPVAASPVERAVADTIAADARALLARVDPPVLLAGVAAWTARHPDAADIARALASGRVDLFWPSAAGA